MMHGIRHQKHETMKTRIILITTALLLGFLFSTNKVSAKTNTFSSAISKTIKYPAFASENKVEGTVWVSLMVADDGTMSVVESNHTCCAKLSDKVIAQLDGKKLKNFDDSMVGLHHVKLVFKLQ